MHVLVVAALYGMFRLGIWQWGRGHETGSIRNYSYGLEWWAFVVLTLAGWVKFCVDETHQHPEVEDAPAPVSTELVRVAPPVSEDEDPDLAAWNARFAELARRDAEASS